ncbi:MAG TPA: FAD/NAD(P)-binding protein [Acidimicrobiales bacterium]|jgi:uncharacterized NAD(P)/FAD-binding protein YdhS|nr:FAD/NAD(P)-binding protein [Acidimicrobiales bacterium]
MALIDSHAYAPVPSAPRRLRALSEATDRQTLSAPAVELAIVGLGPWGLCVLERAVHRGRATGAKVTIHVVEPGPPGGGVYAAEQPDYLILNNPCGQLSLHAVPDGGDTPPYGLGLYEWATGEGYHWFGEDCRPQPGGRPVEPTDYLPRRVMGRYLEWFYRTLTSNLPDGVRVVHHPNQAVDIRAAEAGGEIVLLDDGHQIDVDHVVLTSGHTANRPSEAPTTLVDPYPVSAYESDLAPRAKVAISGMGLVAFDVVTALTLGRGGQFIPTEEGLVYHPSGAEPEIFLYSRSGNPYCAKAAHGSDPTGDYRPVICTSEKLAALRSSVAGVDFRTQVLPLIQAEMEVRFYGHSEFLEGGRKAAEALRHAMATAWSDGSWAEVIRGLAERHGPFDPDTLLFPEHSRQAESSEEYEEWFYRSLADDLEAALAVSGSPVKAASEVTRILRDDIRGVIEFGGLSLESYFDFQTNIRSRINRIEAGPPPLRSAQLLALIDAGIVQVPFGPGPTVTRTENGIQITSVGLAEERTATVQMVIRGHLDLPSLVTSASPLLSRMYASGRLRELSYDGTEVGSVWITPDFHPYDADGRVQANISVLGVLTEGARYFTHFLPSPKSRLRAVLDASSCVEALLG